MNEVTRILSAIEQGDPHCRRGDEGFGSAPACCPATVLDPTITVVNIAERMLNGDVVSLDDAVEFPRLVEMTRDWRHGALIAAKLLKEG